MNTITEPIDDQLISILIPVYNEEEFLHAVLAAVLAAPLPTGFAREIVIVDDGSTDATPSIIDRFQAENPDILRPFRNASNRGKGYSVRRAIEEARGIFSVIQDADLEYNPADYPDLFHPLVSGSADAVFGSRFAPRHYRRVLYFWHSIGNQFLTAMTNLVCDLNLTDMETCYKAFRTSLVKSIPLTSDDFSIEPELTIKLAKRQARIFEVPISYEGRSYAEGKKIGKKDAIIAVASILRFALSSSLYKDSGEEILDAFSIAPHFNRWMADVIRKYVGKSILEIGAGMGNLTTQLTARAERYIASDINQEHLHRLKGRLRHRPTLETRICDLSNSDDFLELKEAVDTVICLNVLEHLEDDLLCARNMFYALSPKGCAIVLVPHRQGAYGTLDNVLGHFRRYSRSSLTNVLAEAGFEIEELIAFNRISFPAWILTGKILRRKRLSRMSLRVFNSTVWVWRRLDSLLPFPPTSIIAVARKPEISVKAV